MAFLYEPPPCASEVMRTTAKWVARLYGVKVTVTVEGEIGQMKSTFDRRPRVTPCTLTAAPDAPSAPPSSPATPTSPPA
jgi:hypothetical protein